MDFILFSLIFALATGGVFGLTFAIIKIWHIPSMNLFLFVMACLDLICAIVAVACVFQITLLLGN
jgi:hypothetical protein